MHDLKRFCCDETEFKPFTVDPTFNIGQFNVTPISYQHLLLETRRENNHPTLIGPVLIHERKTEETYSTFASSLKALEPGLTNLMAFGTDDEKALENGFNNNFERATQRNSPQEEPGKKAGGVRNHGKYQRRIYF